MLRDLLCSIGSPVYVIALLTRARHTAQSPPTRTNAMLIHAYEYMPRGTSCLLQKIAVRTYANSMAAHADEPVLSDCG